jgi:hypothetical protein
MRTYRRGGMKSRRGTRRCGRSSRRRSRNTLEKIFVGRRSRRIAGVR